MKKFLKFKNIIIAVSAIVALIVGSIFLIMYSNSKTVEEDEGTELSSYNSIVVTPSNMCSYGELMFAYVGENNYLYNLDDESEPLIEQPVSNLLYASDDTVIYTASVEIDDSHSGREFIIQELQIGEHENNLYTIATVSVDPCWSSNDEVVYFVNDDNLKQLCTFEPLTSTTEVAATFDEDVKGLRISSDGLLVTVASGAEKLYVPLSKTLTAPYFDCNGSRLSVCEQYDLILTPEGTLSYKWIGANESTKIADNVIVAEGYQDNEILFIQNTEEGIVLKAYFVSEESLQDLATLPGNILPQLTISADYAFVIDSYGVVYKYVMDSKEFYPFMQVDETLGCPMISVFDYRLMVYDLAREDDSTFVTAVDATTVPTSSQIAELNNYVEAKSKSDGEVQYNTLEMASIGADVVSLQSSLNKLGYLDTITGIYDVNTKVAVQRAQYDLGDAQTGIADNDFQTSLFSDTLSECVKYPVLSKSSTGIVVRNVQARLKALEYMVESPTGELDEATVSALSKFAEINGLKYDGGMIKSDVLSALFSKDAKVNSQKIALNLGDCAPFVMTFNQRLKDLGYLAGSVNPSFDAKTLEAVNLLKATNGQSESAECNAEFVQLVYSDSVVACPEESRPTSLNDTETETETQVISDRQLKVIRKWLTKQFAVNHTDKQAVKRLQMQLVKIGLLDKSAVSMIYDQATFDAVSAFQSANDLEVNGIASKNTLTSIFNIVVSNVDEGEETK